MSAIYPNYLKLSRLEAKDLQEGEIIAPISVKNREGNEVFGAEITFYLSNKKAST